MDTNTGMPGKAAAERKRDSSFPKKGEASFRSMHAPGERWRSLQRTAGNQAVQRVLAGLKIGSPDDPAEREADRAADAIVRMPGASFRPTGPVADASAAPDSAPARIDGFHGSGQAPSDAVRAYFAPRLGRTLAGVRFHIDSGAAQLARSLNARAFTVGRDILFGAGEYAPETIEGKRLIAHELAHVAQQRDAPPVIRRKLKLDPPAYTRINPIDRILNNRPIGLTTPTINGHALPDNFNQAGQLLLDGLQPKEASYEPKTKECRFNDFDATVSSDVIIPTEPEKGVWRMDFPGAGIAGIPNCHDKKVVPVVMTGKPSSEEAGKWIEKNEQEHVDDLKTFYDKHLKPHFDRLMKLKVKSEDGAKCGELLMKELGNKDAIAIRDFLNDWTASIKKRDEGGKHTLHNDIKEKDHCSRVEIESVKK